MLYITAVPRRLAQGSPRTIESRIPGRLTILSSITRQQRFIYVNNLAHQGMLKIEESGPAYMLPYFLNRDAGGQSFEDVLIIGAGSGNDVAAALRQGARHVDAVEIDPVIYDLGRRDHPNRPYRDPRVTVHLEDGRGFVRKTEQRYDLIIYALVDSLALHSSYSSVRLESFLFTEEAFRDVKAKLKPGGVFALYNYYRQGWVVGRLEKLAETVFGARPIVDLDAVSRDDHGRRQSERATSRSCSSGRPAPGSSRPFVPGWSATSRSG